jgi:hypothetical protein
MPNPAINVEINYMPLNNEISNISNEESGKKKKNRKKKKFNSNYQKNKIKNWDDNSNNSKGNNKSSKNLCTPGYCSNVSEQKMKFYEDETSGFTIYDHEDDEDSDDIDNYLSPDEK